jgi:hypothetical protein
MVRGRGQARREILPTRSDVDPLLTEALALHDGGTMRLQQARAHIDLGVALRRAGKRPAARGPLERGADLATACQAGPLAGSAREELRILGAKRVAITPARCPLPRAMAT